MNKVSMGEAKQYLGLDGEESNKLLAGLLATAEHMVEKTLRQAIPEEVPEIVRTAVLFSLWQLYFHRDNSEFNTRDIELTLAVLLSDIRKVEF